MAGYSYKYVRDRLPPYLELEYEGYEGGCYYDGDMWILASDYIDALENELSKQYAITKAMSDERLLLWLKTRPKMLYNEGPAIIGEA